MNSKRQRDPIDQLLRQSLRTQADAAPAEACLEADLLAAWIDGALTREELVRAESHAAGCARCQAILSSMARTAPVVPRRQWWARTATVRWLVPIAAVVALAVWIGVPPAGRAPAPVAPNAADRAAGSPVTSMAEAPAAPADEKAQKLTIAPAAAPRGAALERKNPASLTASTAARKAQETESRLDRAKDAQAVDSISAAAPLLGDQAAAQPKASAPPPALLPYALPAAPPPPAAARAAARPEAVNESLVAQAQASPVAGFVAGRGGVARPLDILSPDPAVRWRLGGTGMVQRSIDRGVTWTTQQTGTTILLSAGSSPSTEVCWLVGRAGTVLLSTNGATWQLRPFPEGVDLIAIRATDAKTATVTTADGRQFSTTDGGATWIPAQESPAAPFYQ